MWCTEDNGAGLTGHDAEVVGGTDGEVSGGNDVAMLQ